VILALDVVRPAGAREEWSTAFERRVRDVASKAVAHIKRFDAVSIKTSTNQGVRADRTTGADPLLRFLALVETSAPRPEPPAATSGKQERPPPSASDGRAAE
jgi:uncharacterized protein (DUF58 family)